MKFPAFFPVTREPPSRDRFARDSLLQQRVRELSVPERRNYVPSGHLEVQCNELYRQQAEAAAERSKPQPVQSLPQPGSMEWFEAQK
jgi:hypothetical protein